MKYNRFGKTPLTVSEIGFGCARLGGIVSQNQGRGESPVALLHKAFDAGITYYDTADMYTQGESETLLGKAFHDRRDKVIIASKGGYCLPARRHLIARIKPLIKPLVRALGLKRSQLSSTVSGTISQDFSPNYLINAVEASLRRLNTDYLDLYQLHSPPSDVLASGEFLVPLETLKAQGKIRHFGVAAETVEDALLCLRYPAISSLMIPFGLLDLEALEGFFAQAEQQGVAVIARGCYGGGLLKPSLSDEELPQVTEKWQRILAYREITERNGRSLLELALQFTLAAPSVAVHLLGMRTGAHLQASLNSLTAPPLSDGELEAILEATRKLANREN